MNTIRVSVKPSEAASIVRQYVEKSALSAECIGAFEDVSQDGREVHFLVFEKYFMRNSSRASLSVVFENVSGVTTVGFFGSGGGQSALFKFDWGSADSFAGLVENALREYRIG